MIKGMMEASETQNPVVAFQIISEKGAKKVEKYKNLLDNFIFLLNSSTSTYSFFTTSHLILLYPSLIFPKIYVHLITS